MIMNKKHYSIVLILVVVCFFTWFSNWLIFQYQLPPGDDPAVHLEISNDILDGQWVHSYPPAFHATVMNLNLMTGVTIETILIFLPLFILGILIPLTLLLILKRFWGWPNYLIGLPFCIFLFPLSIEMYSHGQFPEIAAVFLGLVLLLSFFFKRSILIYLLVIGVFFAHHLTSIPIFAGFALTWIFRNIKKAYLSIIGVVLALGAIFLIWPHYFKIFTHYPKFFFSKVESIEAVVPLMHFLEVWRVNNLFIILLLLGVGYLIYLYKDKEKRTASLFILFWLLALIFFSRYDYGDYSLSARLIRIGMFPGILLIVTGLVFIFKRISFKFSIPVIIFFLVVLGYPTIKTINYEYSPYQYERIKQGDLEIIDYIKKNTSKDAVILFPGKSESWWSYLSGREFIRTERNLAKIKTHELYWNILEANITDPETIKSAGIDYIYQVSPSTFYEVSLEAFIVYEYKLIDSGLWEVVAESDRARLLKFKDSSR